MRNGFFEANSNEHDEYGGTTEDPNIRNKMMRKRLKKLEILRKDFIEPNEFGDKAARIGIIGLGSTYGVIRSAINTISKEGNAVKYLQIRMLLPFPIESLKKFVDSCDRVYVVEHNACGQLTRQILYRLGLEENNRKVKSILRYDGLAFRPKDIIEGIQKR
jgi:2-oxoglutarate ferredoxin oxidoreductase subunit alpha